MKKIFIVFFILATSACENIQETAYVDIGINDNPETLFSTSVGVTLYIDSLYFLSGEEEMYSWKLGENIVVNKGFSGFISLTGYKEVEATTYSGVRFTLTEIDIKKLNGDIEKITFPTPISVEAEAVSYITLNQDDSIKIAVDLNLEKAVDFETGEFKGFETLKMYVIP